LHPLSSSLPLAPLSPLFPYTTLFRSPRPRRARDAAGHSLSMKIAEEHIVALEGLGYTEEESRFLYIVATHSGYFVAGVGRNDVRSEEHTSELQSRGHLVCRLLLETKK